MSLPVDSLVSLIVTQFLINDDEISRYKLKHLK
jgi:hypothetical protein